MQKTQEQFIRESASGEGLRYGIPQVPVRIRHSSDQFVKIALFSILALCIVRYWILPLSSSFWVDEMGTAFVVHYGALHPSFAAAPQVPASIYYVLPKAAEKVLGFSEISYRLPSLFLMGISLYLIAQIARKSIHPDAGWFAVFMCLALRGFNYEAADARPYALGTCVAAACLLAQIRWFDSGRLRDGLLFAILAALVWSVHLIFWPFYLVLITYALVRAWKSQEFHSIGPNRKQVIAVFSLLWVLCIPVAIQAIALARHAGSHVITEMPRFSDISRQTHVGMIVGIFAGGTVLAYWLNWGRRKIRLRPGTLVLTFGWWLCQPLLLFLYSKVTGNSVFVTRYLSLSFAGTGLVAAVVAALFLPQRWWKPVAAAAGIYVFLFVGDGWSWRPLHHNSNWRHVVAEINSYGLPEDTPVLAPSPFVEAQPPVWSPNLALPNFFYSHTLIYPVRGSIVPLPYKLSKQAKLYATDLSASLAQKSYFVIYGGDSNAWTWQWLMTQQPALEEWQYFPVGGGKDVEGIIFVRPGIELPLQKSVAPNQTPQRTTTDQSRAF